jgi:heme a synthase
MRNSQEINFPKWIYYWLMTGIVMVLIIVMIGGITRLTRSGLSIVEWKPITGVLPPMNEMQWEAEFEKYKQSPEFRLLHTHFALIDYKRIFFWEYIHRLWARLIGFVFIIPAVIIFSQRKYGTFIKKRSVVILLLGIAQALAGWIMVKSGLVDQPHVSHYKLAIHLLLALAILLVIYDTAHRVKYGVENTGSQHSSYVKWIKIIIGVGLVQIVYGALVAGLKAGYMYNSFPMFNDSLLPPNWQANFRSSGVLALFENPSIVQFLHRWIGVSLFALISFTWIRFKKQEKSIFLPFILMLFQVVIGIFTLIYVVPIGFAVVHQVLALIVLLVVYRALILNKYKLVC